MWIVILALKRPYTFVCASLLVFIFGVFSIVRMAVDVFPVIPMPVATVVWYYTGMAPHEMEGRMIQSAQRFYSSVANDIEHIESSTYNGVGVIKIYFQPNADVAMGVAEITAASQAILKIYPPGGSTRPTCRLSGWLWAARRWRRTSSTTSATTSCGSRSRAFAARRLVHPSGGSPAT
jgi:multidrug efflux pump subunit AcrB